MINLRPLGHAPLNIFHLADEEYFGEYFPCNDLEKPELMDFIQQLAKLYQRKLERLGFETVSIEYPCKKDDEILSGEIGSVGFKMHCRRYKK